MTCPKCKAKVGMVPHQIATELGRDSGAICYMCGYWLQNYLLVFGEIEAGLFLKDAQVLAEGS